MGEVVMITEPLIGLVRLRPLKKSVWFMATPKSAQSSNKPKSLLDFIGSEALVFPYSQNSSVTEDIRSKMKPNGSIYSGIATFATV
ncbi:hypothetical protein C900_03861 [Fulvivirga imtechensis AK7]|uniref:Uncharacterized protein n=1 Tax=Fulvivirga imtechensis AK7 TaxID=1237149 RepID=L8JMM5_9BACT|nr:hypothetical protein C900_03861 [Fulvivirga imtechensis AK7]